MNDFGYPYQYGYLMLICPQGHAVGALHATREGYDPADPGIWKRSIGYWPMNGAPQPWGIDSLTQEFGDTCRTCGRRVRARVYEPNPHMPEGLLQALYRAVFDDRTRVSDHSMFYTP